MNNVFPFSPINSILETELENCIRIRDWIVRTKMEKIWKKFLVCVLHVPVYGQGIVAYDSVYDIISQLMVAFLGVVGFVLARSLWWCHICANMSFGVSSMFHFFLFPFLLFFLFASIFLLFFLLFFQSVSFRLILNKKVVLPHGWPKW